MVPSMAGTSPIRLFIRVDFPTPLRPITATISPSRTSISRPCRTGLPPYPARRPSAARMTYLCSSSMRLPQIDRGDAFVGDDLLHRTLREHAAEMQNGDPLRDLAHECHVVLDRQHRHA